MAAIAAALITSRRTSTQLTSELYQASPSTEHRLYKIVLSWAPSDLRLATRATASMNSNAPVTASLAVAPTKFASVAVYIVSWEGPGMALQLTTTRDGTLLTTAPTHRQHAMEPLLLEECRASLSETLVQAESGGQGQGRGGGRGQGGGGYAGGGSGSGGFGRYGSGGRHESQGPPPTHGCSLELEDVTRSDSGGFHFLHLVCHNGGESWVGLAVCPILSPSDNLLPRPAPTPTPPALPTAITSQLPPHRPPAYAADINALQSSDLVCLTPDLSERSFQPDFPTSSGTGYGIGQGAGDDHGWVECLGVVVDDDNVSSDAATAATLAMARGIANSTNDGARQPWAEASSAAAAARMREQPTLRVKVGGGRIGHLLRP